VTGTKRVCRYCGLEIPAGGKHDHGAVKGRGPAFVPPTRMPPRRARPLAVEHALHLELEPGPPKPIKRKPKTKRTKRS